MAMGGMPFGMVSRAAIGAGAQQRRPGGGGAWRRRFSSPMLQARLAALTPPLCPSR